MNARAPKTRRNQHDSTRSGGGINHTPKRSPFVPIGSGTDGLLAIGVPSQPHRRGDRKIQRKKSLFFTVTKIRNKFHITKKRLFL